MKALKNCDVVTVSFRALDLAEQKATGLRIDLAQAILTHRDTGAAEIGAEIERLVTLAKGIIAEDGYESVTDPKNLWAVTRNYLLAEMMRGETVEVSKKVDGDIVKVKTPVEDVIAKGTKAINTVASQLREKAGMMDGRSGNTRKPRQTKGQKAQAEGKKLGEAKGMKVAPLSYLKGQLKNRSTSKDLIAALVELAPKLTEAAKWEGYVFSLKMAGDEAEVKPKKARETKEQRDARLAEAAAQSDAEIAQRAEQLATRH